MKKTSIAILSLIILMSGCTSNPNGVESTSNSMSDESSVSAPMDNPASEQDEQIENSVTYQHKGISFECSEKYDVTDDGESVVITFEPKKAFATIQTMESMSTVIESMTAEQSLELSHNAYIAGFEEIQSQVDTDISVADIPAKASTFTALAKGINVNIFLISFDLHDINYMIMYTVILSDPPAESHTETFLSIVDSIQLV